MQEKNTEKKPLTKKAVETRQKLLAATIEQVAKQGYHNVTVDEIAKACGLSTGSAYRYFNNKKEMLIAAIEYAYSNIQSFSGTEDKQLEAFDSLEDMLAYVLQQFYRLHKQYEGIHEELESLRHIDAEIRAVYEKITWNAVDALMPKCSAMFGAAPDLRERLYAAVGVLENCAQMQMNDAMCKVLDMEKIQNISIDAIITILRGKENAVIHD